MRRAGAHRKPQSGWRGPRCGGACGRRLRESCRRGGTRGWLRVVALAVGGGGGSDVAMATVWRSSLSKRRGWRVGTRRWSRRRRRGWRRGRGGSSQESGDLVSKRPRLGAHPASRVEACRAPTWRTREDQLSQLIRNRGGRSRGLCSHGLTDACLESIEPGREATWRLRHHRLTRPIQVDVR